MTLSKLIPVQSILGTAATKEDNSTGALSDTLKLKIPCHGFHALATGLVQIVDEAGNESTVYALQGQDYLRSIRQIKATGTALTNAQLVLLYGA